MKVKTKLYLVQFNGLEPSVSTDPMVGFEEWRALGEWEGEIEFTPCTEDKEAIKKAIKALDEEHEQKRKALVERMGGEA